KLFNTDQIISVNIIMDSDEWRTMLDNATSEEYYSCDVVINGTKFKNVGIRPKGNTSLSSIANDPDTDRYSLKLEFGHFVEGQTCFGLDKLILNNNYADATNMKEAIIYDMYQFIGATSSLYNYAKVSVNGEYWGVYLALEGVEDSFILRNYGTQDGEIYKPDSMEMGGDSGSGSSSKGGGPSAPGGMLGGGNFPGKRSDSTDSDSGSERPSFGDLPGSDFDPDSMPDMSDFNPGDMPAMGDFDPSNMPDMSNFDPSNMPQMGDFDPSNMPGGFGSEDTAAANNSDAQSGSQAKADSDAAANSDGGDSDKESQRERGKGGFSMGNGGANLNYSDDDLDSYSTIWDGEITETSKGDHRRVVTALKNISEGTDLETYLDVDNILKYMAVHVFSVNQDSLSGSMAHNYYLYEYDGQLNLFPWDYNLSLGGMAMGGDGDATSVVNDAIDTPFSGTQFFDALLENEEYLEKYHSYLQQLVDEYVNSGRFEETYNRIRSQIDSLVETDPTAFYSYEEYDKAAELLYETIMLRAQSIDGQLAGTIPSTDDGQRQDDSALVDASHINVKEMGQFNMGGFMNKSDEEDTDSSEEVSAESSDHEKAVDTGEASSDQQAAAEQSADQQATDEQSMDAKNPFGERPSFGGQNGDSSERPSFGPGGNMPSFDGMPGQQNSEAKLKNLLIYGGFFAAMLILLLICKGIKRKHPAVKKKQDVAEAQA
ncbi:MAG: CotH kinase family protein, partial [Lachnospiraceae bacterium]|nr:CotH kinase family protein [Lachnospiraceae bacterium]